MNYPYELTEMKLKIRVLIAENSEMTVGNNTYFTSMVPEAKIPVALSMQNSDQFVRLVFSNEPVERLQSLRQRVSDALARPRGSKG